MMARKIRLKTCLWHPFSLQLENLKKGRKTMKKRFLLLAAGMLALPSVACATGLDFSFNDEAAQVVVSQTTVEDANGRVEMALRGLYADPEDTLIGSFGVNVLGKVAPVPGLEIGAGVKGYFGDADKDDILAGGLGFVAEFEPEALHGVGFAAEYYYCPRVFSGLDTDRLTEFEAKVSYEIAPRAGVFGSYSEIRADIEDKGYLTVDDGFRIGLELEF